MGAESISELIQLIADQDVDICNHAVKILAEIGLESVPDLIQRLGYEANNVGYNAVKALGKLGTKALSELIQALKDKNSTVRINAARALEAIELKTIQDRTLAKALSVERVVTRFRTRFDGCSHIYCKPNILTGKLRNAIAAYCSYSVREEDVLVLFDATMFGSAKTESYLAFSNGRIRFFYNYGNKYNRDLDICNPKEITKHSADAIKIETEVCEYFSCGLNDEYVAAFVTMLQEICRR